MFKREEELNRDYNELLKQNTLSTAPEDILTFLGKKLRGEQAGKIQTSYKRTYFGIRIKQQNRNIIIKIYNKAGRVLRIEITFNKASELRVIQEVHQKDGQTVKKLSPLKKSIYSMEHYIRFAKDATRRYLDFLNQMDNNSKWKTEINQFTERKTENNKNYKGFNPFNSQDNTIFQELLNGLFISNGFRNKDLKSALSKKQSEDSSSAWTTSKISRLLKRLRVFGLLKRLRKSYKYFLTEKGKMILSLCVKLRAMTVIPACDAFVRSLLCA
jgi:flagellar hook assembly protein FlgD